jgi:nitroimidazol reductase NimA-like FMN-containing flavoprotein (pyridoxamine 5'-phosphate oxidase superfamily)
MPERSRPHMPKDYGVPGEDEGMLDWSHATEVLAGATMYWVCSVRPDGRPHAVPVWGAYVDDVLYLETGGHDTRKARNIDANPQVVVHVERGADVVIVEGTAARPTHLDADTFERIRTAFAAKYQGYRPETYTAGTHVVAPRVAFAWNEFPKTPTRWTFGR